MLATQLSDPHPQAGDAHSEGSSFREALVPSRLLISRPVLVALVTLWGFGSALAFGKPGVANPHAPAATQALGAPRAAAARLVDINSAGKAELKSLPGIDDAAAERIVAARPYPSKAKLVADQVISYPLFMSLKDHIVAIQKPPPGSQQPVRTGSKP